MFPVLARFGPFGVLGHQFGPFTLHTYGMLVALGFLAALVVVMRGARREGLPSEPVLDLAFVAVLAAIVGSRLLYVLFNLREYLADPLRVFKVWEGGLVFHGGLLLAIPACLIFVRRSNLPAWATADVFAPAIALGQAIGRIGCFAAGCCYGAPWDPPFCVTYTDPDALAPLHVPLFPSQLFAFASGVVVFAVLARLPPAPPRPRAGLLALSRSRLGRPPRGRRVPRRRREARDPALAERHAGDLARPRRRRAADVRAFGRRSGRLTLPLAAARARSPPRSRSCSRPRAAPPRRASGRSS